jgi:hypothetical protein
LVALVNNSEAQRREAHRKGENDNSRETAALAKLGRLEK